MKKKATIKDVAKYANVSISTVSNVLNNIDKASEETKKKVLEAMEILEYHPNFTARSLVRQKSNIIGIVFPKNERLSAYQKFIIDTPFYTEYLSGIEYGARQNNYDVLITGIGDEDKCKNWIMKRNLDGVIFFGKISSEFIEKLEELQIPFSLTDAQEEYLKEYNRVGIDDELGSYIATRHLIELGHQHIAYVFYDAKFNGYRSKGYKRALEEAGIALNENIVFESDVTYESGYNTGHRIIKSNDKITAIVAAADILAFGIIKALKEVGKEVPRDYSVVGFDDIKECEYFTPGLTTIHQDIFEKGAQTIKVITDALESNQQNKGRIELPIKLVIRESTRAL